MSNINPYIMMCLTTLKYKLEKGVQMDKDIMEQIKDSDNNESIDLDPIFNKWSVERADLFQSTLIDIDMILMNVNMLPVDVQEYIKEDFPALKARIEERLASLKQLRLDMTAHYIKMQILGMF